MVAFQASNCRFSWLAFHGNFCRKELRSERRFFSPENSHFIPIRLKPAIAEQSCHLGSKLTLGWNHARLCAAALYSPVRRRASLLPSTQTTVHILCSNRMGNVRACVGAVSGPKQLHYGEDVRANNHRAVCERSTRLDCCLFVSASDAKKLQMLH